MKPVTHLEGESRIPLLREPEASSDRTVVITQGPGNHAIRSQHWRYIRYADGSEELYNHRKDPNEFTNLAGNHNLSVVKDSLAGWFPEHDAPLSPEATIRRRKTKPSAKTN